MEQSGRLFSFVNKQIRKKHLIEGMKHTQIRQQSRSQKLKNYYQVPQCSAKRIYLYSNVFGNQFIFRQEAMMDCEFQRKSQVYSLLKDMHFAINKICYNIWREQKLSKTTLYFPKNKKTLTFSLIALIFTFLFASFLFPLFMHLNLGPFSQQSKSTIFKLILLFISLLGIICLLWLFTSLLTTYVKFDYDRLIIRALANQLKTFELKLSKLGLKINCDKELTWIQILQKGSQLNIFQESQYYHTEISQPYASVNEGKSEE